MGTREGINKEVRKQLGRNKKIRRLRTRHMPTKTHTPKPLKKKREKSDKYMDEYLAEQDEIARELEDWERHLFGDDEYWYDELDELIRRI